LEGRWRLSTLLPLDIYDALLIRPIDPEREIALLENSYEILHDSKAHLVLQEDYELVVIRKGALGWALARKIVFSRTDLQPHRQCIYDEQGRLLTDARHANYNDYDGVSFPSCLEIVRPQEEYDITLNILKLEINKPLRDEQFALVRPPRLQVTLPASTNLACQPRGMSPRPGFLHSLPGVREASET
jgi:hypothetical protein